MVWALKYGRSLLAEITMANASFSIRVYLSSAPQRALLVKQTSFCTPFSSQIRAEVESTNMSIRGNRKLSFGHALFISVKFVHILHLPLDFFTTAIFANHYGQCTSRIKSAWSSFSTSSAAAQLHYGAKLLCFCFIGFAFLSTLSQCTITDGSIPGMSS